MALEGDALISKLDKPRLGDAMYDHDGRKVLVMDERVSQLLDASFAAIKHSQIVKSIKVTAATAASGGAALHSG